MRLTKIPDKYFKEITVSGNELWLPKEHQFSDGYEINNILEGFQSYRLCDSYNFEKKYDSIDDLIEAYGEWSDLCNLHRFKIKIKNLKKKKMCFYEENGKYFVLSGTSNLYKEFVEGSKEFQGYLINLEKYVTNLKKDMIDEDLDLHKILSMYKDLYILKDLRDSFIDNNKNIINKIQEIETKYMLNLTEISEVSSINLGSLSSHKSIYKRLSPEIIPFVDAGFIGSHVTKNLIRVKDHEEQKSILQIYLNEKIGTSILDEILFIMLKNDKNFSEIYHSDYIKNLIQKKSRVTRPKKPLYIELLKREKKLEEENENLKIKNKKLEEESQDSSLSSIKIDSLKEEIKKLDTEIDGPRSLFNAGAVIENAIFDPTIRNNPEFKANYEILINRIQKFNQQTEKEQVLEKYAEDYDKLTGA